MGAAAWDKGRYSTLTGFVESGESLEDAVRRETWEETQVAVDGIQYRASQPWPFPRSLMVGFVATADSTQPPTVDGAELEDARWFSKAELRAGAVTLPPPGAISRLLISEHLATPD